MKHSGFELEHCRPNCPKLARNWNTLFEALKTNLAELNIQETLERKFGQVLHHHIPKICIAGCPNGCSQPDIKDFGISGYVTPQITEAPCTECNACVRSCLEGAITLEQNGIVIDNNRCLSCGNCQSVCPSGTLTKGESGWNLRIGGRVGRHPRFATFAGQVSNDEEVIAWVLETIQNYINNGLAQERLTHFLENRTDLI
ncbi:4Fe-4S dicluster domain-containing protein [Desulfosporosinus sp.]|uniref:4Fe-4S dicluster domain-containing protein n=1 Tax=Desulfosporosinus sp. TaxID=157907 RepID=UPI00231B6908|nr:4Fe-4S dicluster domain-containing protein [Desulfosporosinus sp.]MCO5386641.1 4Fe-4S dicluster domain-containing protein [Desulfosporosinus sp.]MDA8222690.1 4Fe-4S dicluster domain-containing protein [Desulfitobacterium hafniense]